MRQALWPLRDHPGFKLVASSKTYTQDYRRARFCAAPLGEGWGIRLSWAVASGCIPVDPACSPEAPTLNLGPHPHPHPHPNQVVFRSQTRFMWAGVLSRAGQAALKYDQFAVVVSNADIPRLPQILGSIGPARRRMLRAGLHAVHRLFLWDPPCNAAPQPSTAVGTSSTSALYNGVIEAVGPARNNAAPTAPPATAPG